MINLNNNYRYSFYSILIISLALILFNLFNPPGNILSWDVFGYYLYLPLTFIYDNIGLQNVQIVESIREQYDSSSTLYQLYETKTGSWVLKYPVGMAYLYFPFFIIGHVVAVFSNYPADGFSLPYQVSVLTGGIIFSITGYYFVRKVCLTFFSDLVTAITLLIIYFGTNYLLHSSFQGTNAMSHNYLFTLYAIIVWATIKWYRTFELKYVLLLGIFCGLTIIARQSEIVCLAIPVFWGITDFKSLKSRFSLLINRRKEIFVFLCIMIVISLPQVIYWKTITGNFLHYGYSNNPGEGLEFKSPYIKEVLFSFRKGWLIYTPIMIFAIYGLILSVLKKYSFGLTILIYFIFNLYIVASWSNWWYAESFSQRALIPSYALLSLPLALCLHNLFNFKYRLVKYFLAFAVISFVLLNLFQTWQLLNEIIHPSRMTREAYFITFLKSERPENLDELLLVDRAAENSHNIDETKYHKTKEWIINFEDISGNSSLFAYSGSTSFKADAENIYSPGIEKEYHEITAKDHVKLKVSFQIYATIDVKENPGTLVITFEHNGWTYGYKGLDLENNEIALNDWTKIETSYLTPDIRRKTDKLKIYYWHRGKMPVFIDDLKVEVWEEK